MSWQGKENESKSEPSPEPEEAKPAQKASAWTWILHILAVTYANALMQTAGLGGLFVLGGVIAAGFGSFRLVGAVYEAQMEVHSRRVTFWIIGGAYTLAYLALMYLLLT